jgi:hypothetical protein
MAIGPDSDHGTVSSPSWSATAPGRDENGDQARTMQDAADGTKT